MQKSTELRWFTKKECIVVENWFKRKRKTFNNTWQRSDFYLHVDGYPNLSFKIREGRAEIKKRVGNSINYRTRVLPSFRNGSNGAIL
jgi:hypothetical protein